MISSAFFVAANCAGSGGSSFLNPRSAANSSMSTMSTMSMSAMASVIAPSSFGVLLIVTVAETRKPGLGCDRVGQRRGEETGLDEERLGGGEGIGMVVARGHGPRIQRLLHPRETVP